MVVQKEVKEQSFSFIKPNFKKFNYYITPQTDSLNITASSTRIPKDTEEIHVIGEKDIGSIFAPSNFIRYIVFFYAYIRREMAELNFQIQSSRHKNGYKINLVNFHGKKITTTAEANTYLLRYYFLYDLEHNQKTPKIHQDKTFLDFHIKKNMYSKMIFADLYSLELWSIFQYLKDQKAVPDTIQQILLKLIAGTLYTDKNTVLLDDSLTVNDKITKKISKHDLEYGKILIRLINLYKELRAFWITLANQDITLAEKLETTAYKCALLGNKYHCFRHKQTRSSGGKKKAEHFTDAENMLYEYYLKVCDQDISADEIYNKMYDLDTGVIFTPEYSDIHPHIESQLTITKLIKKWDKERNIKRRRKKPHRAR